eukprot:Clim_evm21s171 gene=Clim_evmTU21s171
MVATKGQDTPAKQETKAMSSATQYPFFLGGMASMGAACITHPLDLMKVRMQVASRAAGGQQVTIAGTAGQIFHESGVLGFYDGLSASLLRQVTYSTTRFAVYDIVKDKFPKTEDGYVPLWQKVASAAIAGGLGGFVGSPADMTNVRMQADASRPPAERRNYKHALDGLMRIYRSEGIGALFNGVGPNVTRCVLVTIGQLAFYDQFKFMLVTYAGMNPTSQVTHFGSSFGAGGMATLLTMPADVVKTRIMNAPEGVYKGPIDCLLKTVKTEGPQGLFKGFIPAFVRLGPHTISTFMILEQLRALYRAQKGFPDPQ